MPGVKAVAMPDIISKRAKLNIYQKIVDSLFRPMTLGRLNLDVPEGYRFIYGRGDGVTANIRVLDNAFFRKCVLFGDVGFGESYVDGDWETDDIVKVIAWMILNIENHPTLMSDRQKRTPVNFLKISNNLLGLLRKNTTAGSRKNISAHYDLGNEFYELMLDPSMTYSAAYFRDENESLEDAQHRKYETLCRKLRLKESDRVLEIGSGWGGFAAYAAKNYGCTVTTVTVSQKQYEYAQKRFKDEGLSDRVTVRMEDYRHLTGQYDKIVSIEMLEAVGHEFYETYFRRCHKLLKKDGILALQVILSPDHRYDSFRKNMDWIQKHIFPGSLLPSIAVIQRAVNRTGNMCLHDFEDMTAHYAKTLRIWRNNFNERVHKVQSIGFDGTFIRKWNYYLAYCEAAFDMRNISVAQMVFSRPNNLRLRD